MKIKQFAISTLGLLLLIPITSVNAESYSYTVSIDQPTVGVQVTSKVSDKNYNQVIDRNDPYVYLDTITVQNTGATSATINVSADIQGLDGQTMELRGQLAPSKTADVQVLPMSVGTRSTLRTGILQTPSKIFDLTAAQTKEFDLYARLYKEYKGSFNLTVNIESQVI